MSDAIVRLWHPKVEPVAVLPPQNPVCPSLCGLLAEHLQEFVGGFKQLIINTCILSVTKTERIEKLIPAPSPVVATTTCNCRPWQVVPQFPHASDNQYRYDGMQPNSRKGKQVPSYKTPLF